VTKLAALSSLMAIVGPCPALLAQQPASFSATPTSGRAPLTVRFCSSVGISIDFGDGTSGGMGEARAGDCPNDMASHTTHTYTAPGTYQLRGFPCPGVNAAACGQVAQLAGNVKITVTQAQ
jgi:hypothetical protein